MTIHFVILSTLVDGNQHWGFESFWMWCFFTGLVFPFISKAPCYVPQDPIPQQHHCGNFVCCVIPVFPTNHCYVPDKRHGIITQERVNNNVLHCVKFTFFINTRTRVMACLVHALFRPVVWHHGFWTLCQGVRFWICVLHRGWKQHILQPAWKTKGNVIYFAILYQSVYPPYSNAVSICDLSWPLIWYVIFQLIWVQVGFIWPMLGTETTGTLLRKTVMILRVLQITENFSASFERRNSLCEACISCLSSCLLRTHVRT
jgi:hypothetical protein